METQSVIEHNHRNRVIHGITLERIRRSIENRAMTKLARFDFVRSWVSSGYLGKKDIFSDLFPGIDPDEVLNSMSKDGIWRGFQLPDSILGELLDFAMNAPTYGNGNSSWGFNVGDLIRAQKTVGAEFIIANYYNAYEQSSTIRKIAHDPVLNEIALRYVGPSAKFLGSSMWWSYASRTNQADRSTYAQLFHYDLDDYKFIKFFFYLTDVDLDSGPHVYVKGTHQKKPLRYLYPMRRFQDSEIEEAYPKESVLVVEGNAGDGFVEDTFGIHKGTPPISKDRLIIEFYYAISKGYANHRDPETLKMIEL